MSNTIVFGGSSAEKAVDMTLSLNRVYKSVEAVSSSAATVTATITRTPFEGKPGAPQTVSFSNTSPQTYVVHKGDHVEMSFSSTEPRLAIGIDVSQPKSVYPGNGQKQAQVLVALNGGSADLQSKYALYSTNCRIQNGLTISESTVNLPAKFTYFVGCEPVWPKPKSAREIRFRIGDISLSPGHLNLAISEINFVKGKIQKMNKSDIKQSIHLDSQASILGFDLNFSSNVESLSGKSGVLVSFEQEQPFEGEVQVQVSASVILPEPMKIGKYARFTYFPLGTYHLTLSPDGTLSSSKSFPVGPDDQVGGLPAKEMVPSFDQDTNTLVIPSIKISHEGWVKAYKSEGDKFYG